MVIHHLQISNQMVFLFPLCYRGANLHNTLTTQTRKVYAFKSTSQGSPSKHPIYTSTLFIKFQVSFSPNINKRCFLLLKENHTMINQKSNGSLSLISSSRYVLFTMGFIKYAIGIQVHEYYLN